MFILQRMFGVEKANAMLAKWNSLTPEQQQAEMQKIKNMNPQEKSEILKQNGTTLEEMQKVFSQSGNNNTNRDFKY